MIGKLKPETIARRAAEQREAETRNRAAFLANYNAAALRFPLPATPPTDHNHIYLEFADGRAVSVTINGWREE